MARDRAASGPSPRGSSGGLARPQEGGFAIGFGHQGRTRRAPGILPERSGLSVPAVSDGGDGVFRAIKEHHPPQRGSQLPPSPAWSPLENHFTIRLTISGVGEICTALARGEHLETGTDDHGPPLYVRST
jgi:hypothetical protein